MRSYKELKNSGKVERHFYWIDLARSIAATFVLFWHYQHFYYPKAGSSDGFVRSAQPIYAYFAPLYEYGHYGVQFFWTISGFVFCSVYLGKKVSAKSFAWSRIARLYPLHLITLFVVAALQVLSRFVTGHEQIYANNDLTHFALQLLFASNWISSFGFSFNGPIWSVSVEIVIYALFWAIAGYIHRIGILAALAAALLLTAFASSSLPGRGIAECGAYFFIGCVLFMLFKALETDVLSLAVVATVLFWLGYLFAATDHGVMFIVVGTLVAVLTLEASNANRLPIRVGWFGNLSYGMYLWHVPIQISLLIGMDYYGSRAIVDSPWFLLGFVGSVIAAGYFSFVYIESPSRSFIARLVEKRSFGSRREVTKQ